MNDRKQGDTSFTNGKGTKIWKQRESEEVKGIKRIQIRHASTLTSHRECDHHILQICSH